MRDFHRCWSDWLQRSAARSTLRVPHLMLSGQPHRPHKKRDGELSMKILRLAGLVPTFRSSCSIAAPAFTNFGKSRALANLLILVPLIDLKSLKGTRRLRCRDFRSAVLAAALLLTFQAGAFAQ